MKQSSLLTKLRCLPKVGINKHILKSYLLSYSKKFTIICFTSAQLLKGEHDLISDVRVVIRWN